MISRVTNQTVLQQAGEKPLTSQLLIRQVVLFGRIALQPHDSIMRKTIFEPYSYTPKVLTGRRRRDRPRLTWVHTIAAQALQVTGGSQQGL